MSGVYVSKGLFYHKLVKLIQILRYSLLQYNTLYIYLMRNKTKH